MSVEEIIQGGALTLLAATLLGLYRFALKVLPIVERLARVLGGVEAELEGVREGLRRLDGRGVCPLLERRQELGEQGPATEPEA